MGRVLVVTGMHRSGTSLVASYLQRAGLDIGDDLRPPDVGNPKGYFEDAVIHDFHRELLEREGVADGFTVTEDRIPVPFTDDDVRRAAEIAAKRDDRPQWGWKEPRTALFLDLWAQALPHARFLLLFRPPLAVLDSLLRRASNESVRETPAVGLVLWRLYNAEMLRFSTRHPASCLWAQTDSFIGQPDAVVGALRERFDFDLDPLSVGEVYDGDAYHREVRGRAKRVARKNRSESGHCEELYEQLVRLATAS